VRLRVDGVDVELCEDGATVAHRLGDRLHVRSASGAATAAVARAGETTWVSLGGRVFRVEKAGARRAASRALASGEAHAPMPGQVAAVLVAEGDAVHAGQKLLVIEAMKTQQPVTAAFAGTVRDLPVRPGQQVREGDLLVRVEPHSEP
jgi:3-methylcrotonyl-CoA carboxylase alpha subunit